jgi:hypothetical protein
MGRDGAMMPSFTTFIAPSNAFLFSLISQQNGIGRSRQLTAIIGLLSLLSDFSSGLHLSLCLSLASFPRATMPLTNPRIFSTFPPGPTGGDWASKPKEETVIRVGTEDRENPQNSPRLRERKSRKSKEHILCTEYWSNWFQPHCFAL